MAAVGDSPELTQVDVTGTSPILLAAQAFCRRRRRELGPLCRQSVSDARDATGPLPSFSSKANLNLNRLQATVARLKADHRGHEPLPRASPQPTTARNRRTGSPTACSGPFPFRDRDTM